MSLSIKQQTGDPLPGLLDEIKHCVKLILAYK